MTPEEGPEAAVSAFISYAERDGSEFAKRLEAALKDQGFEVWVDYEGIALGTSWRDEIRQNLVRSDVVLFVITPGSAASTECRHELDYAAELGKRIIPINQIPVPTGDLPELIPTLNWVPRKGTFEDAFDENQARLVEQSRLDPEWLRKHTEIQEDAVAWSETGHARGHLLRGSRLADAEAWLAGRAGKEPAPTALHDELIFASRKAATRRQRGGITAALAILVVIAALAVVAVLQRQQAVQQRKVAIEQRDEATARALASSALLSLDSDPEASVDYAARSLDIRDTPAGEDALRLAIDRSDVRVTVDLPPHDPDLAKRSAAESSLGAHESGTTLAVTYRPDGKRIAASGSSGDLRVLDAADAKILSETDEDLKTLRYSTVDFDPTGKRILFTSTDGVVRIVDAESGDELVSFRHGSQAIDAAFSPNGSLVATYGYAKKTYGPDGLLTQGSGDPSVRIWDASSGKLVREFSGAASFAFVDNRRIAISDGATVSIADLDTGATIKQLETPAVETTGSGSSFVSLVAVGPEHNLLAVTSGDTIQLYDLGSGKLDSVLRGHEGPVRKLAASADGAFLASASNDGTARVWKVATGSQVAVLGGHGGFVQDVAFDPKDPEKLVTAAGTTVRLWDVQEANNLIERVHPDPIDGIPRSYYDGWVMADGEVAVGDGSSIVDLVGDKPNRDLVKLLSETDKYSFYDADVAPDGTPLVVAATPSGDYVFLVGLDADPVLIQGVDPQDGTAGGGPTLIDATRKQVYFGGERLELIKADGDSSPVEAGSCAGGGEGETPSITPVDLSPDGDTLLTKGPDGACAIPLGGGKPIAFESPGGLITDAVFLDGGTKVVTGGLDRVARIWDLASGRELLSIPHDDSVVDVERGVDDSYFLSITGAEGEGYGDSTFGRVSAWSVSTGRLLFSFPGQHFVAQRDDGAIVTGSDVDALVYGCDVCRSIDDLRELAGERVTRDIPDPLSG